MRMTEELEAKIRKQAEHDAGIERAITRDRKRRRRLTVGLSLTLSVAVAVLVVVVGVKVTTPSAGEKEIFSSALTLREQGDLNGAARELRQVLGLNPDHGEARWVLGITLNEIGDGRGGEKELRQARMLGRKDVNLTVALLESLMLQRRYTEVLVETVSASLGSPDARLLVTQGEAQMGLAQYDKSLQTLGRALELDPDNVPAMLAMTRLSLIGNDLDEAQRYLAVVQKLDFGHPQAQILAGRIELARGRFELAREAFGAVTGADLTPEISLGMAQAFLAEGRPDAAGEHLVRLETVVGPVPELRYLQGLTAIQKGELAGARTILAGLLSDSPEHIDGLFLMAWVNHARQEYRQAEGSLRRLLNINRNVHDAHLLLAAVQLELDQPDVAIEILSALEEQAPAEGPLLALSARAYMQAGRVDEAEAYLDEAAKVSTLQIVGSELLGTEGAWRFTHCGSLVHYCRQCLYLRECR